MRRIAKALSSQHAELPKIAGNIAVLCFDRVFRLGATLALEIWMAHSIGVTSYGIWTSLTAMLLILGSTANLGIEMIAVRELVAKPTRAHETLGTVAVLKFAGAVVACVAAAILAFASTRSGNQDNWILVLLSAGLLFQSFDVFDYWFQAHVSSQFTILARNIGFLVASVLKVSCILTHASLWAFAATTVLEAALSAAALAVIFSCNTHSLGMLRYSFERAKELLVEAVPMLTAHASVTVYMRSDVVLLRHLKGPAEAGLLTAVTQLCDATHFVGIAIVTAMFPRFVRSQSLTGGGLHRAQELSDLLVAIAYGLIVCLWAIAPALIPRLYGSSFLPASGLVPFYAPTILLVFMGLLTSAAHVSRKSARLLAMSSGAIALLSVCMNWLLLPTFSVGGAITTKLITFVLVGFGMNAVIPGLRPLLRIQLRSLWPFGRLAGHFMRTIRDHRA